MYNIFNNSNETSFFKKVITQNWVKQINKTDRKKVINAVTNFNKKYVPF